MPVTTQTFRNQTTLHRIFGVCGVLLALSMVVAVMEDWANEYRKPQTDAKVWRTAFSESALRQAEFDVVHSNVLELEQKLADAQAALDANPEYQRLPGEIADLQVQFLMLDRVLNLYIRGNIAPTQQRIEWLESLIQTSEGTDAHRKELDEQRAELARLMNEKITGENRQQEWTRSIDEKKTAIREYEKERNSLQDQLKVIMGRLDKAQARVSELSPGLVGQAATIIRGAPLLDFLNPEVRPKQQVVSDAYLQLNLLQGRVLDRCQSCHINIDDPAFSTENLYAFLEKEIAGKQGQNPEAMGDVRPVIMVEFWEQTLARMAAEQADRSGRIQTGQRTARERAIAALNALLKAAPADHPIRRGYEGLNAAAPQTAVTTEADLKGLIGLIQVSRPEDWKAWYAPVIDYRDSLRDLVQTISTKQEYRALDDVYRRGLVSQYNQIAKEDGRPVLSADRVLLAHPNLKLYAGPDSKHPLATMGCTTCHDGAGEETQFVHSAHIPSDIWVDSETGGLISPFLVVSEGDENHIDEFLRSQNSLGAASDSTSVVLVANEPEPADGQAGKIAAQEHGQAHEGSLADESTATDEHHDYRSIHADHYYADPHTVADPFGPRAEGHVESAAWIDPATNSYRRAVKQEHYWEHAFGWEHVHYHIWEFPMHELRFVESSCIRCHTEVADIEHEAPKLFKGRTLFAGLGCVTCHAVDQLGSYIAGQPGQHDVRQVGPSLVHLREKLSPDMIGSWIYSPKAFRPTTRMPHFFQLENNSSPIDIRRTRAEVAAMSYYLTQAPIEPNRPAYVAEPPPADLKGDAGRGREIFKSVGCLACHANVNETGLDWVTLDLQERFALTRDDAVARIASDAKSVADASDPDAVPESNVGFFELDGAGKPTARIRPDQYTRLLWYLKAYQSARFTIYGPELSGVGTKLLAGRTPDQATQWTYDWLRHPNHYSDYTTMPSLRLSEQEALDLSAYLLNQKHPTYQPDHFEVDEPMLEAIYVNLMTNAISEQRARAEIVAKTADEKMMEIGKRVIQHYGCFSCHQIPGIDSSLAGSANVTAYGIKDPHKLDFGYFHPVYDTTRPSKADVWLAHRSGLEPDAVHIREDSVGARGIERYTVGWEHVEESRRAYLENKLHDTRIFDRNKVGWDGAMTEDGRILWTDLATRQRRLVQAEGKFLDAATGSDSGLTSGQVIILDLGQPYLKSKMPNFFVTADQAEALTTYVSGLRPPLVKANLQKTTSDLGRIRAHGRYAAEAFNCMGCHNAQNNTTTIEQYYVVRNKQGEISFSQTIENLVNAPPRIVGNGAKTQHEWFYNFLNNVQMLRPWLKVRMPSFNLEPEHSQGLVDWLAGDSAHQSHYIASTLGEAARPLHQTYEAAYTRSFAAARASGQAEAQADTVAKADAAAAVGSELLLMSNREARSGVTRLATEYRLFPPNQLPNRDMNRDELASKLGQSFNDLVFLRDTYAAVDYPFVKPPTVKMDALEFYRGEKLILTLGCTKCHVVGDNDKLGSIYALVQAAAAAEQPAVDEEPDPYADEADPYADDSASQEDPYADAPQDDPYGDSAGAEEDPYGDSAADAPAQPKVPSIMDVQTAPNLLLARTRLQPDYVERWLQKPTSIMPGTKMPHLFGPDGNVSAFANFPPDMREKYEAMFGRTAQEQITLLRDWLVAVGDRRYTMWPMTEGQFTYSIGEEYLLAPDDAARQAGVNRRKGEIRAWDAALDEAAAATAKAWREEAAQAAAAAGKPAPGASPDKPAGSGESTETPVTAPPTPKPKPPTKGMDPAAAQADRDAKIAAAMQTSGANGRIVGLSLFDGAFRPQRETAADAIQDCVAAHKADGTRLYKQDVIINANGTLANVLVYLSTPPEGQFPAPAVPAEIDQIGCAYIPHVISVSTGQKVRFVNSDPFAHNLKLAPEINTGFNEGQPVAGMVKEVTFDKPEMSMVLKCDVHSWMGAYLHVFPHPFHSVSNSDGVFVIDNVPPGTYEVAVRHEKLGEQKFTVTVEAGKAVRNDLTFSGK